MDLYNDVKLTQALPPKAAGTDNTPYVSAILDTANFEHNLLAINIGTNTDANATFTVLLEDGDDSGLSDNAAVDDAYLLGTEALAGFNYGDDGETRKLGYRGMKRYIRATITPAGNDSGNIYISGLWLQSGARTKPQS